MWQCHSANGDRDPFRTSSYVNVDCDTASLNCHVYVNRCTFRHRHAPTADLYAHPCANDSTDGQAFIVAHSLAPKPISPDEPELVRGLL